jgi:MFS family permease
MAQAGMHDPLSPVLIASGDSATDTRSPAKAWYALAVLVLATLFAFIDRQILVLIVEPLKHDLALCDTQIGALQGLAFALFSLVAAMPLAWLADRFQRSVVLLTCVLFWSVATAACGFANNFPALFACTVGVAIGEAALAPIVYSLIPDLFPGPLRIRANIIYFAANVLGVGVGLSAAGMVLGWVESMRPVLPQALRTLAGWRLSFLAVALPGPLIALAIAFIGKTSRAVHAALRNPSTDELIGYFRTHGRSAFGVFLGAGFGSVAAMAFFAWLPVAMVRAFDLVPASVGAKFGLSYSAGAGVGLVLATITTPLWRRCAGAVGVPRGISVTGILAVIPTLLLGFVAHPWVAYLLVTTLMSLVITGLALAPTFYQDMAPPAIRARVLAVLSIVSAIMGAAGQLLVGAIADHLGGGPRVLLWVTSGVMSIGFILCALCYRATEAPLRRTVAALQSARTDKGDQSIARPGVQRSLERAEPR